MSLFTGVQVAKDDLCFCILKVLGSSSASEITFSN